MISKKMLHIKKLEKKQLNLYEKEIEEAFAIRKKVFIEEQGVSEEDECDGLDSNSTQYIAYLDGSAVATARVQYVASSAKIQRVAVLKEFRSIGIGKKLMLQILEDIKDVNKIVLSAQLQVIDFYEKLGFIPHGDKYHDAGILHRDMTKHVSENT